MVDHPKRGKAESSPTRTLVAVIVFLVLVAGLAIVVGGSGDDGGGMAGMDGGNSDDGGSMAGMGGGNGTMTDHDMANMPHEMDDMTPNGTTETNGPTGGMGNMS